MRAYMLSLSYTHALPANYERRKGREKKRTLCFLFFLLQPFDVHTCACIVQLFFFFVAFFFLIIVVHCRFFVAHNLVDKGKEREIQRDTERKKKKSKKKNNQ